MKNKRRDASASELSADPEASIRCRAPKLAELRRVGWIIILCASLFLNIAVVPASAAVLTTPSFTIIYAPKDKADARMAAQYLEQSLARVSRDLGVQAAINEKRVPVHVFSSRPDFLTGTGTDEKTLIVGRAWSVGNSQKIEIDASGTYARLETVIAHEVTHVVIARILGPHVTTLPLWANEGIARIESGESGQADTDLIGDAMSGNRLMPLKQLEERFPNDNERAGLAYAEGTSCMEFVRQEGGRDSLKKLLSRVAETGDFPKAQFELTGMPLDKLEAAWRRSVGKSYAAGWLPRNLPAVIGIAMALLCIAAYKAIQRKRRWNSAKWLIEESYYEAEPLDYGDPPD